jgi:hypothetical protein
MKKTVSIEIEETVTETRIVVPDEIHCPACGSVVSAGRTDLNRFGSVPLRVEMMLVKPEKANESAPDKEPR